MAAGAFDGRGHQCRFFIAYIVTGATASSASLRADALDFSETQRITRLALA
jgi:hypothetical protein